MSETKIFCSHEDLDELFDAINDINSEGGAIEKIAASADTIGNFGDIHTENFMGYSFELKQNMSYGIMIITHT